MTEEILAFTRAVRKEYESGRLKVTAVDDVSIEVHRGTFSRLLDPVGVARPLC